MPSTIWKSTINLDALLTQWYAVNRVHPFETTVHLPDGAIPLSVHRSGTEVALYALVDPTQVSSPRRVVIAGTGRGNVAEIDLPRARFLGTVGMLDDTLVLHVWVIE